MAVRSTQSLISTMRPDSSATARNSCGERKLPSGMRQRISASTCITSSVCSVDQRLIEQLELAVLNGAPQSLLDDELRRRRGQQLRREVRELAAPQRLGAEQRRVGGPQQCLGIPFVIGKHADSDAHAHDDFAIVDLQRAFRRRE